MATTTELHQVSKKLSYNKFYRLTRFEGTVLVRFGRRGSHDQTQIKRFGSQYDAQVFYDTQLLAKQRKGYEEVFTHSVKAYSVEEAEEAFTAAWRDSVAPLFILEKGRAAEWWVFEGLESEAYANEATRELLARVSAGLHGKAPGRDVLVGLIANSHRLIDRRNGIRPAWLLGVARGDETEDDLNMVAAIFTPAGPRGDLLDAVRRARVGTGV